jgi:hypothetical protein
MHSALLQLLFSLPLLPTYSDLHSLSNLPWKYVKILEEESFSNIVNTILKQNKSRSEKEDCWTDSSSPPATSTWDTNPKSYRRSNIRTRDIKRLNTKDTYRSQSKGENVEHGSSCWSECRRKKHWIGQ